MLCLIFACPQLNLGIGEVSATDWILLSFLQNDEEYSVSKFDQFNGMPLGRFFQGVGRGGLGSVGYVMINKSHDWLAGIAFLGPAS